jgi:hypothetical protein
MCRIVETYNTAVKALLSTEKSKVTAQKRLNERPCRALLKHILQQVR